MSDINFIQITNFKCKRCGCTSYDKIIHTGLKTIDEENSIINEQYVCRNCDFPISINEYNLNEEIKMPVNELLNQAKIIDEGIDIREDEINEW